MYVISNNSTNYRIGYQYIWFVYLEVICFCALLKYSVFQYIVQWSVDLQIKGVTISLVSYLVIKKIKTYYILYYYEWDRISLNDEH